MLIEEGDALFPVEIKSGTTVASEMFRGLEWWCDRASRDLSTATLVYAGDES